MNPTNRMLLFAGVSFVVKATAILALGKYMRQLAEEHRQCETLKP